MIHRLSFLFCFLLLASCNDGDILTVNLDFDKELSRCDNDISSYLIYDTKTDPNESLSLIIDRTETNELLFTEPTPIDEPVILQISLTTNRVIYRSYNRAILGDELCDIVVAGDLNIVENYPANNGTIEITTTIEDDDGDGISSEDEGRDPNGDGDYSDARNSDADGPFPDDIPDYLDEDDDNDNIKTSIEISLGDSETSPLGLDSDGDGTLDYLDNDDDDDGILTRLEDADGLNGPFNDEVIDVNGLDVKRYLYNLANDSYDDPGSITNSYTRFVTTSFTILNAGLEIINAEIIDFGTYSSSFSIDNIED